MRQKTKKARRANPATKANVRRQGATAATKVPKSVINALRSAMKSLGKAQTFLDSASTGSKRKAKIGRPRKDKTQTDSPA